VHDKAGNVGSNPISLLIKWYAWIKACSGL